MIQELWKEIAPVMDRLAERWESEWRYEPIADYAAVLAPYAAQHHVTFALTGQGNRLRLEIAGWGRKFVIRSTNSQLVMEELT